jgi:hypothetical protein
MFAVVSQRTVPLTWPLLRLSAVALAAVATAALPLVMGINTAGAAFGFGCLAATMLLALPLILQIGDAVGVTSDLQRTIHRRALAVLQRISAGA